MSNLPDGVTEDDLPGNRPEDIDAQREFERLLTDIADRWERMDLIDAVSELLMDHIVNNLSNEEIEALLALSQSEIWDWIREHL